MYSDTEKKPSAMRKTLVAAGLGLAGGAVGYLVGYFLGGDITRWEDDVNLVMATALLAMTVITAFIVAFRPSLVPKGCGLLQMTVLVLAGVMLLAPIFGTQIAPPELVLAGVVGLLILQTVANVWLWFKADEMFRRVMLETSAMAFWVLQGALFVYAAAERLELVESITAWGMVGILMAVYMLSSCVAAARRGMT